MSELNLILPDSKYYINTNRQQFHQKEYINQNQQQDQINLNLNPNHQHNGNPLNEEEDEEEQQDLPLVQSSKSARMRIPSNYSNHNDWSSRTCFLPNESCKFELSLSYWIEVAGRISILLFFLLMFIVYIFGSIELDVNSNSNVSSRSALSSSISTLSVPTEPLLEANTKSSIPSFKVIISLKQFALFDYVKPENNNHSPDSNIDSNNNGSQNQKINLFHSSTKEKNKSSSLRAKVVGKTNDLSSICPLKELKRVEITKFLSEFNQSSIINRVSGDISGNSSSINNASIDLHPSSVSSQSTPSSNTITNLNQSAVTFDTDSDHAKVDTAADTGGFPTIYSALSSLIELWNSSTSLKSYWSTIDLYEKSFTPLPSSINTSTAWASSSSSLSLLTGAKAHFAYASKLHLYYEELRAHSNKTEMFTKKAQLEEIEASKLLIHPTPEQLGVNNYFSDFYHSTGGVHISINDDNSNGRLDIDRSNDDSVDRVVLSPYNPACPRFLMARVGSIVGLLNKLWDISIASPFALIFNLTLITASFEPDINSYHQHPGIDYYIADDFFGLNDDELSQAEFSFMQSVVSAQHSELDLIIQRSYIPFNQPFKIIHLDNIMPSNWRDWQANEEIFKSTLFNQSAWKDNEYMCNVVFTIPSMWHAGWSELDIIQHTTRQKSVWKKWRKERNSMIQNFIPQILPYIFSPLVAQSPNTFLIQQQQDDRQKSHNQQHLSLYQYDEKIDNQSVIKSIRSHLLLDVNSLFPQSLTSLLTTLPMKVWNSFNSSSSSFSLSSDTYLRIFVHWRGGDIPGESSFIYSAMSFIQSQLQFDVETGKPLPISGEGGIIPLHFIFSTHSKDFSLIEKFILTINAMKESISQIENEDQRISPHPPLIIASILPFDLSPYSLIYGIHAADCKIAVLMQHSSKKTFITIEQLNKII